MTVRLNLHGRNIVLRLDNDILNEAWRGSRPGESGGIHSDVCAHSVQRIKRRSRQAYAVREEKEAERGMSFSGWWKAPTGLALRAS